MKLTYKYVILGAGASGLTTAFELSKIHPGEILVLEKDNFIGGLCKTINKNDAYYDLGAHPIPFQIPEKTLGYINEMSANNGVQKTSGAQLRLNNAFISYPVKSFQFLLSLGLGESFFCILSLIKHRFLALFKSAEKKCSDYEAYMINKTGKRAYKTFYGPLARKEWGCEPKDISAAAAKDSISMNPIKLISSIFKKNIVAYYYMDHGIGDFAKGIAKKIIDQGVTIYSGIQDFDLKNEKNAHQVQFSVADSRSSSKSHFLTITYEKLISTIPVEELVAKLNPEKAIVSVVEKIKWRGLKLVYIHLNEEPLLPGETFYFPETDYIFGQISITKRFSDYMQPDQTYTCFVCEVPCSEGDKIWKMTPEAIIAQCFKDLIKANLIKGDQGMLVPKNFVIDLNKVTPLYINGWQDTINQLLEYLGQNHKYIYSSGKGGFFMTGNMTRSIEMGIQMAQHIAEGKDPASWYENSTKYRV